MGKPRTPLYGGSPCQGLATRPPRFPPSANIVPHLRWASRARRFMAAVPVRVWQRAPPRFPPSANIVPHLRWASRARRFTAAVPVRVWQRAPRAFRLLRILYHKGLFLAPTGPLQILTNFRRKPPAGKLPSVHREAGCRCTPPSGGNGAPPGPPARRWRSPGRDSQAPPPFCRKGHPA